MGENTAAKTDPHQQIHPVSLRPESEKQRTRRSFYLDGEVISAVDQIYREVNHQLYPAEISKSIFLETLIGYGLNNLDAIKSILAQQASRP